MRSYQEADMRSPEEAYMHLEAPCQTIMFTGVSDVKTEEKVQCVIDANISIRPYGRKIRYKNRVEKLNSF